MKYINSRDNYLKKINEKRQFELERKLDHHIDKLILETYPGSGAMGNEITWGDSLVGRLINAVIRKAQIGANMVLMKPLISRLRAEFEDILSTSQLAELDPADKLLLGKVTIYAFLNRLEMNVAHLHDFKKFEGRIDPVNLPSLIDLTKETIKKVEDTEPIEKKNELLRQLNDFLEYLEGINPDDYKKKETFEEKSENKLFNLCIENLKSVLSVVKIYGEMQERKFYFYAAVKSSPEGGSKRDLSATSASDSVEKYAGQRKNIPAKYVGKSVDDIYKMKLSEWQEEQKKLGKNTNAGEGTRARLRKEAEAIVAKVDAKTVADHNKEQLDKVTAPKTGSGPSSTRESYIYEEVDYKDGEAPKNISTGDSIEWDFTKKTKGLHINQAIKPLYNLFKSEPGVIEELETYLKLSPEEKISQSKTKSPIQKIYTLVKDENFRNKYVVKEGLDNFLTRPDNIAQKIVGLYSISVKNDVMNAANDEIKKMFASNQENLVLWDKMMKELVNFNATMRGVISPELQFGKSENKEEKTQEKLLLGYDKFVKMIIEADETPAQSQTEPKTEDKDKKSEETAGETTPETGDPKKIMPKKLANEIQDWWEKKMDLNAWVMKESEVEKIKVNLEKTLAEKKDAVIIDGMDPIMNIVRIFNRSYNLHTNNTIPGARTGGKVSRSVYNEYIPFGRSGGGEPNAQTEGPYRHKKTFAIWNDAVIKIMGERKFQPIFNKNTEIRVGNVLKRGAGVALRKFMTEMLDGEEPFKKGAQQKMLDRYFGDMSDENFKGLPEADLSWKNPTTGQLDVKDAYSKAALIKQSIYKFVKPESIKGGPDVESGEGDDFIKEQNFSGKCLQVDGTDDKNKDVTYYFFIQDVVGDFYYISYSSSFLTFKNYLLKVFDGESIKTEKGDGEMDLEIRKKVRGTIISKNHFLECIINNKLPLKINSVSSGAEPEKVEDMKFITKRMFWLIKETKEDVKGKETVTTKAVDINDDVNKLKTAIKIHGGFEDIKANLEKAEKPTTVKFT
jgi:hypothetical protein